MKEELSLDAKRIGTGGEYMVTGKLLLNGIDAHRVNEDYYPYDIVTCCDESHEKMVKIQVKTAMHSKAGFVQFELKKKNCYTKKTGDVSYSNDDVDYYALYSVERDKVYMVPYAEASSSKFRVRFEEPKIKQTSRIHWESEYTIEKFKQAILAKAA